MDFHYCLSFLYNHSACIIRRCKCDIWGQISVCLVPRIDVELNSWIFPFVLLTLKFDYLSSYACARIAASIFTPYLAGEINCRKKQLFRIFHHQLWDKLNELSVVCLAISTIQRLKLPSACMKSMLACTSYIC